MNMRRVAVSSSAWLDELLVVPLTNDLLLPRIVLDCKRLTASQFDGPIWARCSSLFGYVNDFVSHNAVCSAAFFETEDATFPAGVTNDVATDDLTRVIVWWRCSNKRSR